MGWGDCREQSRGLSFPLCPNVSAAQGSLPRAPFGLSHKSVGNLRTEATEFDKGHQRAVLMWSEQPAGKAVMATPGLVLPGVTAWQSLVPVINSLHLVSGKWKLWVQLFTLHRTTVALYVPFSGFPWGEGRAQFWWSYIHILRNQVCIFRS